MKHTPESLAAMSDLSVLELIIKELTAERNAALAQNADLVAQVEVLKNHMAKFTEINSAFDAAAWENKSVLLRQATPAQCLRQIQADAGLVGYFRGTDDAWRDLTGGPSPEQMTAHRATQYAARVKAGE